MLQFEIKGPLCDPSILVLYLWHSSLTKKHNSQFSVKSDTVFVSYAQLTVHHTTHNKPLLEFLMLTSSKYKLGNYFAK